MRTYERARLSDATLGACVDYTFPGLAACKTLALGLSRELGCILLCASHLQSKADSGASLLLPRSSVALQSNAALSETA